MAVKFFLGVCMLLLIEGFYLRRSLIFRAPVAMLLVIATIFLGAYRNSADFIYFQF
jgi:hypothetical protein